MEDYEIKAINKMKGLGFNPQFVKEMEETRGYGDMPGVGQIEKWAKEYKEEVKNYDNCNKFYYWATLL